MEMPFLESHFRFGSRSKRSYRMMSIQQSAHLNLSIDRLVIDGAIYDVALSRHEHAVDRQEPVDVDIHPVRCRRF